MTLTHLQNNMTFAELTLWMAYFGLMNDKQEQSLKKARSGRR
jgi:hypothetical protein